MLNPLSTLQSLFSVSRGDKDLITTVLLFGLSEMCKNQQIHSTVEGNKERWEKGGQRVFFRSREWRRQDGLAQDWPKWISFFIKAHPTDDGNLMSEFHLMKYHLYNYIHLHQEVERLNKFIQFKTNFISSQTFLS